LLKQHCQLKSLAFFPCLVYIKYMPNIKSAEKRLRQDEKKHYSNLQRKKEMKKLLKEARVLIKEKKKDDALKILPQLYKAVDKAVKKNVLKQNNGARKKSRVTKAINSIK